jgi:hypothetical protein
MPTKTIAAIVLVLLVGYGLIEARHLIAGPSIVLTIPTNYTTSPDGFVAIKGTAKNTENLMLNGGPLLIDGAGNFADSLLLPKGSDILTFTATDRFGRSTSLTRTIYID